MHPAVFLDRDGTIIEDMGYIGSPDDTLFLPGVGPALQRLQERYRLFMVTNQSGVGLGHISREEAEAVNHHVVCTLAGEGVNIERVYTCFHAEGDGCTCRKPAPRFLFEAAREYSLDLSASFVVGDHLSDIRFALNGGATGLYVLTGHGSHHAAQVPPEVPVFPDLVHAAEWILTLRNE